jgi:hypothetical protein
MENNTVVYRHIRQDTNEVFYIGIGSKKRAYSKHGRNKWWNRIVDKTNYRVDILFDDMTWEQACEKEKEFIELYGRKDLGLGTLVNHTNGGDGTLGVKMSEKNKIKMSQLHKGKKRGPMSEETKRKLSEIRRNISDETKQKISNSKKGKQLSDYHKLRIKQGATNKRIVLQIDLDGNIVKEWSSAAEVELCGLGRHQHIYRVCKGIRNTHRGYKWKYKDE